MKDKIFTYKFEGKEYAKFDDTLDKALRIKDKKKAKKFALGFMDHYRKHTIHADSNIGYFIGYYGSTERRKLHSLFGVRHPFFGVNY